MECTFKPGDVVVCVIVPKSFENKLSVNGVYTVAELNGKPGVDIRTGRCHNEIGVRLNEVKLEVNQWFYHWYFRPAKDTDLSQFDWMLSPDPDAELKRANTRKTLEKIR